MSQLTTDGFTWSYDYSAVQNNQNYAAIGELSLANTTGPNGFDYTFDSTAGRSWSNLSYAEKAQVVGYKVDLLSDSGPNWQRSNATGQLLYESCKYWKNNGNQLPDSVHDLASRLSDSEVMNAAYGSLQKSSYESLGIFLYDMGQYFHLDTGKLMKINHDGSSLAGGMTLHEVDDQGLRRATLLLSGRMMPNNIPQDTSDYCIVYYRIYDSNGQPLTEDVYAWHPDWVPSVEDVQNSGTESMTETGTTTGATGSTASKE